MIELVFVAISLLALVIYTSLAWYYQTNHEREVEVDKLRAFNLKPESLKADSEFFEAECPPSQFAVFMELDNTKKLIGHGFRLENSLVMPAHVLGAFAEDLWITKGRRVRSGWTYDWMVRANTFTWKPLAADVVAADIGNKSLPGLKKASVAPYWGDPMVSVATYFDTNNCSIGSMKPSSFGMLEYSGSTRGGFSGAIYLLGQNVVAMHLGGGVANVAVAASYLKALLYITESSEIAALKNSLKKARKQEVQWSTTGDPDQVQVHIRGRYYIVGRDDFEDVYEEAQDAWDDYQDEYERKQARRKKGRDPRDYERDEKYRQSVNYDYDDEKYQPESALRDFFFSKPNPVKCTHERSTQTELTSIMVMKGYPAAARQRTRMYRFLEWRGPPLSGRMQRPEEITSDDTTTQSSDEESFKRLNAPFVTVREMTKCSVGVQSEIPNPDYVPECQENSKRLTPNNKGGPSKGSKNRIPSPSPVGRSAISSRSCVTRGTSPGLSVTREPFSRALESTTLTGSRAVSTSASRRLRRSKQSRHGSRKDAQ